MSKPIDHRSRVVELASALASPHPMRKGSVGERWMKCGQKSCACQHDKTARHGPYYSLTVPGGGKGKTRSRYISWESVPVVRAQIQALQEFRENVKELIRESERWADAELARIQAASDEAAKKGASKSPLRGKSRGKSKHS